MMVLGVGGDHACASMDCAHPSNEYTYTVFLLGQPISIPTQDTSLSIAQYSPCLAVSLLASHSHSSCCDAYVECVHILLSVDELNNWRVQRQVPQ